MAQGQAGDEGKKKKEEIKYKKKEHCYYNT